MSVEKGNLWKNSYEKVLVEKGINSWRNCHKNYPWERGIHRETAMENMCGKGELIHGETATKKYPQKWEFTEKS